MREPAALGPAAPRLTAPPAANGGYEVIELRACSACAGDYEDPDRSAWPTEDDEEREEGSCDRTRMPSEEEFPAERP